MNEKRSFISKRYHLFDNEGSAVATCNSWVSLAIGCFVTQKHYHRQVLVHATKKVVLDVTFNKHTIVGKNLPPVLHTFSKKGYESSLKHKWVRLRTTWRISMKSKRNVSHSFNSISTHIITPTKQSAAESTRNKIHAIKRIEELPRDFMIHLSESILAIPY